jgi:hypothetical protein
MEVQERVKHESGDASPGEPPEVNQKAWSPKDRAKQRKALVKSFSDWDVCSQDGTGAMFGSCIQFTDYEGEVETEKTALKVTAVIRDAVTKDMAELGKELGQTPENFEKNRKLYRCIGKVAKEMIADGAIKWCPPHIHSAYEVAKGYAVPAEKANILAAVGDKRLNNQTSNQQIRDIKNAGKPKNPKLPGEKETDNLSVVAQKVEDAIEAAAEAAGSAAAAEIATRSLTEQEGETGIDEEAETAYKTAYDEAKWEAAKKVATAAKLPTVISATPNHTVPTADVPFRREDMVLSDMHYDKKSKTQTGRFTIKNVEKPIPNLRDAISAVLAEDAMLHAHDDVDELD